MVPPTVMEVLTVVTVAYVAIVDEAGTTTPGHPTASTTTMATPTTMARAQPVKSVKRMGTQQFNVDTCMMKVMVWKGKQLLRPPTRI
jgi:hypothetical protein